MSTERAPTNHIVVTEPTVARVAVMAVNPYLLHVYWQVSERDSENIRDILHESAAEARPVLRFYDITCILFDGTNAHRTFDVEVDLRTMKWKVPVWSADKSYVVDLGYKGSEGRFYPIARSNVVNVPRAEPSPRLAEGRLPVEGARGKHPASEQVAHVAPGKPVEVTRTETVLGIKSDMEEPLMGNPEPEPLSASGSTSPEQEPVEIPQTAKAGDSAGDRSSIRDVTRSAGPAPVGDVDLVDFTLERFSSGRSSPTQWADS
jgi:hypothetical protein